MTNRNAASPNAPKPSYPKQDNQERKGPIVAPTKQSAAEPKSSTGM
jgi:hypothetical protein